MDSVSRRTGGGVWEGLYKVIMRRNSVYVTFVVVGAFLGERAVDYGVHKVWEYNNVGECSRKWIAWPSLSQPPPPPLLPPRCPSSPPSHTYSPTSSPPRSPAP